jgi:hypothetical protein
MINTVNKCSKQHGSYINSLKTKIVAFRNRGVLKENEKWYLDGKMIELCNQFVYSIPCLIYSISISFTYRVLKR